MKDAIKLYEEVSFNCSELITKKYSSSFSLGINTLDKKIHKPIYAIYGFVRFADEIVDTFHNLDKETILNHGNNMDLKIDGDILSLKFLNNLLHILYKKDQSIFLSVHEVKRSPTEIFNTLPSKTKTTEGGIICPRVPDDAITPVAIFLSYSYSSKSEAMYSTFNSY